MIPRALARASLLVKPSICNGWENNVLKQVGETRVRPKIYEEYGHDPTAQTTTGKKLRED
jgi:hypothetical protein